MPRQAWQAFPTKPDHCNSVPVLGDHGARDELCPRGKTHCETAGNTKTDDSGRFVRGSGFNSLRET
jgi:hypothetical protein